MSVDTYLKGKNLRSYSALSKDDVDLFVSSRLVGWAKQVRLDLGRFFIWPRLGVSVEPIHRHAPGAT
ncbi:MAG: hypothetical protein O2854_02900 [Chloroflexi bacterium]|nr:hypothetical protein [Chloroflexota bacterium]